MFFEFFGIVPDAKILFGIQDRELYVELIPCLICILYYQLFVFSYYLFIAGSRIRTYVLFYRNMVHHSTLRFLPDKMTLIVSVVIRHPSNIILLFLCTTRREKFPLFALNQYDYRAISFTAVIKCLWKVFK